jgi:hypothetical protein
MPAVGEMQGGGPAEVSVSAEHQNPHKSTLSNVMIATSVTTPTVTCTIATCARERRSNTCTTIAVRSLRPPVASWSSQAATNPAIAAISSS